MKGIIAKYFNGEMIDEEMDDLKSFVAQHSNLNTHLIQKYSFKNLFGQRRIDESYYEMQIFNDQTIWFQSEDSDYYNVFDLKSNKLEVFVMLNSTLTISNAHFLSSTFNKSSTLNVRSSDFLYSLRWTPFLALGILSAKQYES